MIKNALQPFMCSQDLLFFLEVMFLLHSVGNNIAYCQDNIISWLDWTRKEKHKIVFEFFKL